MRRDEYPRLRLSGSHRARSILAGDRQHEHEQSPTLRFVLTGNQSLMILHHAIYGAQSQARPFADRLCRIERIEYSMRLLDARPAIGKLHYHLFSLTLGAHLKQSAAGFLERIQSILDDLDEGLE